MAWLHTVPEKAKQPRYKTRTVPMPPLEGGHYLLNILMEIGPTKIVGMGSAFGIDEIDIAAWQANSGLRLSAWEAQTVRRLSQEYAAQIASGKEASAPPPYVAPASALSDEQRAKIAAAMASWADKVNGQKAKA